MPINNIKNMGEVMYMKIAELGNKPVQDANRAGDAQQVKNRQQVRGQAGARETQRAAQTQTQEQVRVEFGTKRMIEGAVKKAAQMPEVREEKVAQLREQIQQGTYQVSNRQIARAMIGGLLNEIV